MVIGIVAKNGILLLDADHKFRAAGYSVEDAMIQAGRRRLRPIVMTALAAIAGMLPLALALGAGSQMLQPLAIAVIGGIVVSMVLSLVITPAVHFYLSCEGRVSSNIAGFRFAAGCAWVRILTAAPGQPSALPASAKFTLGGEGGWDYLTYDPAGNRLFVAHG